MRKYFTLRINQAGLELIVKHLRKGTYEDVAVLLNEMKAQIDLQLQPKQSKAADKSKKGAGQGPARYAKSP